MLHFSLLSHFYKDNGKFINGKATASMVSWGLSMPTISRIKLKTLAIALVIFWLPIMLLLAIVAEVKERSPLPGDVTILERVHNAFPDSMSSFFLLWTNLGSAVGIIIMTAVLVGALLYAHRRRFAILVVLGVGGAAATNLVLKGVIRRQRPTLWQSVIHENSFSFPSGHAMASSALALCVVVVLWRTRWRVAALIGGAIFMILVGLSRVYFGVHYPSDIVGGWLASFAWVMLLVYGLSHPKVLDDFKGLAVRTLRRLTP